MATIAVVGTLDTKGDEHEFLASQIRARGAEVILIDVGVGEPGVVADIGHDAVAQAANSTIELLHRTHDRNLAIDTMARGAATILGGLYERDEVHGAVALGGGGGTTLAATAFSVLPVGVPKLIVSTVAAGDMRPHVRGTDLTFTYAVLDIAGLNTITRRIIGNAAGAIVGMAGAAVEDEGLTVGGNLVAITAFGVTSDAVTFARARLAQAGYESLVFHAVGSGGESLEALIRAGYFTGVLDLTTTELVDDLVGGVMSAGPGRLTAAAETGTPQVVSVGALDMVNLGPLSTINPEFLDRQLIQHNPTMTLMRTTPAENTEIGMRIAEKLRRSTGPAAVYLPLAGVSAVSVEGGPFHCPAADQALFDAIRSNLGEEIEVVEVDSDINSEKFANAMADTLIEFMQPTTEGTK